MKCFSCYVSKVNSLCFPGVTVWDRGEIVTILNRDNEDTFLVRDSKGNEQLVPKTYLTELPSSTVSLTISCLCGLVKSFMALYPFESSQVQLCAYINSLTGPHNPRLRSTIYTPQIQIWTSKPVPLFFPLYYSPLVRD